MASSSHVSEDPEEMSGVMIPARVNNVALARRSLIGKVCTTRTLNKAAVKEIISKAWNLYPDLHILELGKTMFFFFL